MKSGFKSIGAAGLALALTAGTAQAGDAVSAYYERAFVLAADARCDLFEPTVNAALASAEAQARGAALRAGRIESQLRLAKARAEAKAAATPCASPELGVVTGRVKTAFSGWSRTARMTWPGDQLHWVADRTAYSRDTWRLSQSAVMGQSPLTFGYAAKDADTPRLQALVSFVGRSRPYAARIWLRDTDRAGKPWLPHAGQPILPPADVRQAFWATGWTTAPLGLLSEDAEQGESWTFPDTAAQAIGELDPRERFLVQFLFRDDSVATVAMEAGDFAAARAFLSMGSL